MSVMLLAGGIIILIILVITVLSYCRSPKIDITEFPRKFEDDKDIRRNHYDVIIVGAGPAGSTLAYYLAKLDRKVLLLEKKRFPRDKYCGDAVCKTGIEILDEMKLLDKLLRENKAVVADSGGLCSPGGLSYIGRSKEGFGEIPAAIACKRTILDETIARAAQRQGANLLEQSPVENAVLDTTTGLWTVFLESMRGKFQGRVLVCADGAPSKLAIKLGVVTQAPQGSCSRAFVEGGTHKFKADGVVFYHKQLLPGYAALFRHPNDEVNYCCYLIPGNPKVTNDDLAFWHDKLMKEHPYVCKALGKNYKIERMKAASLRLGGEKMTFGDHMLVIGDAAGMIDPMTGEGIHHAMESGKIAAYFLEEAFIVGNFESDLMKEYQNRWMIRFGYDFKWSMKICQLIYRYPILMDAATASIIRKGDKFMLHWAEIMTGRIPKIHLLRPEFVIVITYELIILLVKRLFGIKMNKEKPGNQKND